MIKIKIVCVFTFLAFGIGMLFTSNRFVPEALSYSTGPPPGHTAGPGEGTCTECHFDNGGPGILTITAPANYTPGQTYQLHVQHSTTDMTRMRWGFQMTSLDGMAAAAGSFTDTSGFTQTDFGNLRFYVEHTETGTFPGTTGGANWTFDWTAPATDVGPVTFYASGNEANNDGTFDGDQIYTTTAVAQPAGSLTPTATATNTPTDTPTSTPTAAGTPSISGTVTYGNASAPPKFVSNVTVTGTGSPNVSTFTGAPGPTAGQYTLTGFGEGSYTVTLSKATGQNSITSNDAARIAQHVAGTLLLTTNNQKVSADVTGNNAISSQDAAKIAQVVAGLPFSPPNLTGQWRFFVPPGPTFPVDSSPTSRIYSSIIGSLTGEDYIGLLIGEVTGNWTNSGARPVGSEQLHSTAAQVSGQSSVDSGPLKKIAVNLPQITASIGKDFTIPVKVESIADRGIISYEFDLRYDPFVIQPQVNTVDLTGTASRGLSAVVNPYEPGLLRVVVYGPIPIDGDGVLLNLRFRTVGTVGSVSALTWEQIMFNEGEPRVTTADGRVELF